MTDIFSPHAPTGQSEKVIVSSNEYSSNGRNIGFPSKFSVYPNKLPASDGSQSVTETREVSDIVGNRLYLYHRPSINADNTITSFTLSDGTLDTSLTNARQSYVVFTSLPSSTFTISYLAVPDTSVMSYFNTLQDDMMEVQKVLGVTNETGYPGIRNLSFALFDTPADTNISGVAQRAVYLPHLSSDIYIGSSSDSNLTGTLGNSHNIQLGRYLDTVTLEGTTIHFQQSNGTRNCTIWLGNKTGDYIKYSGQISGEGPVTIGGPSWSNYSGTIGGTLSGAYYSGAMLRVNGDVAVLGSVQSVGSITVVNLTGEISTIYGDFTITDNLSVYGDSVFLSTTTFNNVTVQNDLTFNGDIVAGDSNGSGSNGQSLVDGLDASEVAHSYNIVIRKVLPNSILNGRRSSSMILGDRTGYTFAGLITGNKLCADNWQFTGFATATAGPSGSHPNIIQVNFTDYNIPIVSGTYSTTGVAGGYWSPGMMDPGSIWIRDLNTSFESPIYGYSIQSGNNTGLVKMNVYCPELVSSNRVQTNDSLLLFNPNNIQYNFLSAAGGASPTVAVYASSSDPFEVSFENEVRKMTSSSSNISLTTALTYSITGIGGTSPTGVAYVFATNKSDPESAPGFKVRNIPYRMPGETIIGEVTAKYTGSIWTILDTTSYRAGAIYDSSWIPLVSYTGSGRSVGPTAENVVFFKHSLGADMDIYKTNVELYLAKYNTTRAQSWDQAQPFAYTMQTCDRRAGLGFSGDFTKLQLTNTRYNGASSLSSARDASLAYIDGKYIGLELSSVFGYAFNSSGTAPDYMRVIIRRDS